ncbi:glutamate synthase-related protein [Maridesulfovibrio frigidus]|uniref:glutamate synthase-related protein n=1 Tax=Maridesulfovibrio frigidus TaxID=340956 RepID=UPI00068DF6F9|nr:glutamate synthase-related protein [Maridesulfovibrio frigidus]
MLFQKIADTYHEFAILRDVNSCIDCDVCIGQCTYNVHFRDTVRSCVTSDNSMCVGCLRCSALCPTGALSIRFNDFCNGSNGASQSALLRNIYTQAETGEQQSCAGQERSVLPVYWDKLMLVAGVAEDHLNAITPEFLLNKPLLLDIIPSISINPNLRTAMKIAADKLNLAEIRDNEIYADDGSCEYVRIAATYNVAKLALEAISGGAKVIVIDGTSGGYGPYSRNDSQLMPIELAIGVVDRTLRAEGMREDILVIAASGIRCSSDIIKALALGADGVSIAAAMMIAAGCSLCGSCNTGKCPWGIATVESNLCKRQNPELAAEQMINLVNAWNQEIDEMLECLETASLLDVRGNKDKLRAVGLSETEMKILGIEHAGL